jgi:uncharacterized protein (DUF1778 family)
VLHGVDRIELRATPYEKSLLARAAIEHLDLTSLIMRIAVPVARDIIERAEHTILSKRDTLQVLELLEIPPLPSSKLIGAAKAWTDNQKKLDRK